MILTASPPVSRTPLHHWHAAHGGCLIDSDGWQVVAAYGSVDQEIAAARAGLGLADISAFAKLSLRAVGDAVGEGQGGVAQAARALAGDGPAAKPRGVSIIAADSVATPTLACRLTEDHLLLLASSTAPAAFESYRTALMGISSLVTSDVTSGHAGFALLGPRTEDLLRRLTALDLAPKSFPEASCAETKLAEVHALLVRVPKASPEATPKPSLPALRIYVSWDLGEYVWEALLKAGRTLGLTPIGLDAWQKAWQKGDADIFQGTV